MNLINKFKGSKYTKIHKLILLLKVCVFFFHVDVQRKRIEITSQILTRGLKFTIDFYFGQIIMSFKKFEIYRNARFFEVGQLTTAQYINDWSLRELVN